MTIQCQMDNFPVEIMAKFFNLSSLDERARLRLVNRKFKESIEYGLSTVSWIKIYDDEIFDDIYDKYIPISSNKMPNYGPNFWTFINKYCAKSINLQLNSECFCNVMCLLPIAEKVKEIRHSSSCLKFMMDTELPFFPNLQILKANYDHHCCESNHLAKKQLKFNEKVFHLCLPCFKKTNCWTDDFPSTLRSIFIDFRYYHYKIPKFSKELSSSLVEFTIKGTPVIEKLPFKFNSLEKLIVKDVDVSHDPFIIEKLFGKFRDSFSRLKCLSFSADYNPSIETRNGNFYTVFHELTNLVKAIIELRIYDFKPKYFNVCFKSRKLTSLHFNSNDKLSLKIISKKLTDLSIKAYMLFDLEMDFSVLKNFSIMETEVLCDVTHRLVYGNRLKSFKIQQIICSTELVHSLFSNLKFLLSLETLFLGIKSVKSLNSNKLEAIDLKNHSSLKKLNLQLNFPVTLIMNDHKAKYLGLKVQNVTKISFILETFDGFNLKIEDLHSNRLIVFNSTSTNDNHLDCKINNCDFYNLETVDVCYIDIITAFKRKPIESFLIQYLRTTAFNISSVRFSLLTFNSLSTRSNGFNTIKWIKSLRNLKYLEAPLTQGQLTEILIYFDLSQHSGEDTDPRLRIKVLDFNNFQQFRIEKRYGRYANVRVERKFILNSYLHELLNKLVRQNIICCSIPWRCSWKCFINPSRKNTCPFVKHKNSKSISFTSV